MARVNRQRRRRQPIADGATDASSFHRKRRKGTHP
jgi:hypothetical protein